MSTFSNNKNNDSKTTTDSKNSIDSKTTNENKNATETKDGKNDQSSFRVSGNWADQSRSLKARFNHLTDQDLALVAGKEHEMLDRVQSRLNKNREEVIGIIRSTEKQSTPATGPKPEEKK
jgi:hypothetical protein